ncbi:MAG: oxaloacetate decarboxylase (Na+ extruding) subunit alpha [Solirubrobacteraceae bacterium]|jgi:oxaloacetate decarboxylase alpha subunit|nr:oxaloacetate decarboxylase (Na+ extruding) subunit alpha [Solirubrobacteraceae bacterium]
MSDTIEIVDTTMRDGNQSLWGATGLTTPDILAIAPTVDRVGFRACDFTSSTAMAVSVRYHREDPWERIRMGAAAMPNTPLSIITTGKRFISWRPAGEEVLRAVFRCVVRNGLRRVQIADPMNDPGDLRQMAAIAKQEGVEEVVIGLTYSVSPVHTDAFYAERAKAIGDCADVDRLYLKDPGGLVSVERLRELAPLFLEGFPRGPVELHSHGTIGLSQPMYMEGAKLGFSALHTAVAPVANGTSNPSCETTLHNLRATGFDHGLDLDALHAMSEHFRALALDKRLPLGAPAEYDAAYYRHQMPGGMVTTMRRQLEEMRRPELFEAALEESGRVRAEFGWPIMVTPFSQFVGTQAVMNVMGGERYATIPDDVIVYFLGHFGSPPAPPDPDVADRVLSLPQAAKLRAVEPLSMEGARARFGAGKSEEELLLRLTMPAEQVDAMIATSRGERRAPQFAPTRPRDPLVRLLSEVSRRPAITYLRLEKGDDVVEYRRAAEEGEHAAR